MNEWMFCTTQTDGALISVDGKIPNDFVIHNVQGLCKRDGWDVEHAVLDKEMGYWHLILSRPFAQARPTASLLYAALVEDTHEAL
jgi:hypothetical protein